MEDVNEALESLAANDYGWGDGDRQCMSRVVDLEVVYEAYIRLAGAWIAKHDNLSRIGYMDKIDFEEELGNAMGGVVVYPSIEELNELRECVSECGTVEVEVRLKRVVDQGR